MTTDTANRQTTQRERRTRCTRSTNSPPPNPVPPPSADPRRGCADGNGTLTPLFFSDDIIDIARAKAICAKCQLAASCLSEAPWSARSRGASGAASCCQSGRIVRNKRPCGRPPKHPRPELIVDELGVVGSVA